MNIVLNLRVVLKNHKVRKYTVEQFCRTQTLAKQINFAKKGQIGMQRMY